MGGTTLHACMLAQWFEMLLLLLFKRYATMIVNGILFGVMQPLKLSNILMGEMFYLTTHSTHFIYGYMASDTWLRTILIVRKETHCRHIGYSY